MIRKFVVRNFLHIDVETFSPVDIRKGGNYKYNERSEIIWFAYSFNDEPVQLVDITKHVLPPRVQAALIDPDWIKVAHNAPFELAAISHHFGIHLDPAQWMCTSVLCGYAGYPLSLDGASQALGLSVKKDSVGTALIKYFCVPCKASKVNGGRTRNLPEHNMEKWVQFGEYCRQDVVVEKDIHHALSWVEIPEWEHNLWVLDQTINRRGIRIDTTLAEQAITMDYEYKIKLTAEAKRLTGLSNPNSVQQLTDWLEARTGIRPDKLTKDSIKALLRQVTDPTVRRVLELRQEMSKTSVRKYAAMLAAIGADDRVRGLLQFYGAGTGRWAGRLLQMQNLPRIFLENDELDLARTLLANGEMDMLEVCFGSIPNILSQLIRTALIPREGYRFIVMDYSAIEAVIIAWVAGEKWRLDVFNTTGKIYEASAARIFNVPVETIAKGKANYKLRAKGKVAELSAGYGGGVNAFIKMGALDGGLLSPEMQAIVDAFGGGVDVLDRVSEPDKLLIESEIESVIKAWRKASPAIVKLWRDMQDAAVNAIVTGEHSYVGNKGVYFSMSNKALLMHLPSGRALHYPGAYVVDVKYKDKEGVVRVGKSIRFWTQNSLTKKWEVGSTYGGKLTENLIQAIARDCLANGLVNLEEYKYPVVGHVHDEAIIEMPIGKGTLKNVKFLMLKKVDWMGDMPLNGAGFETVYYKKD